MEFTFQSLFIGSLEIRWYSVMILSGLLVGLLLAQREAKRLGEDPDHAVNIAVIGAIFALVGARIYHVLDRDQWPYYSQNPGEIIQIWNGGIGIFGAIAGAALGLIAYVWWVNRRARKPRSGVKQMSILRWFDIGAPAFLLGQAIGRWGNLFNQELYGPPTDLPWGIPISEANRPVEHLAETHFHPLFFYESFLSFLGVVVLLFVARRFAHRLRMGDILLLYFVWYPAERSALEFLRSDNWKVGAVPMAQIVGAVLIVVAVAAMRFWKRPPMAVPGDDGSGPAATGGSHSSQRRQRRRQAAGTS